MKNIKLMLEYTKALTILYVEDNIVYLQSTAELFKNYFENIDTASNGQEGLERYFEYYEKNGSYYDLIISDINMPHCNGIDMSNEILKKNSMQEIIFISAHNEIEYLQQAIDIGISGFVTKPININQLHRALHRTSQAISDHKFVESHVGLMEKLNLTLEVQNQELKSKNEQLEKSLRMLDTIIHKEQISHPVKELKISEDCDENLEQVREQIAHLITDDLCELQDILSDIDVIVIDIIDNIDTIDSDLLSKIVFLFARYSSTLSYYHFFDDLSQAILNFSVTLKENPLPKNRDSVKNIFMLLESFMYVLGKWHDDLASGDESKLNALDASIISDMHTIANMWIEKEADVADDNLDDIFDF